MSVVLGVLRSGSGSVILGIHKCSQFNRSKLVAINDRLVCSSIGSPRKLLLKKSVSLDDDDSLGGL